VSLGKLVSMYFYRVTQVAFCPATCPHVARSWNIPTFQNLSGFPAGNFSIGIFASLGKLVSMYFYRVPQVAFCSAICPHVTRNSNIPPFQNLSGFPAENFSIGFFVSLGKLVSMYFYRVTQVAFCPATCLHVARSWNIPPFQNLSGFPAGNFSIGIFASLGKLVSMYFYRVTQVAFCPRPVRTLRATRIFHPFRISQVFRRETFR
jgi:hypothetical protein